ncbi:MAG: TIGR01458 family HAD-type hydrolase [Gammaproteobacteria bacterium]
MVSGVLFDLSGVLYVGEQAVPGAVEALTKLQSAGVPHRFVTNVTRTPSGELMRRLVALGFEVTPDNLFSAPIAARDYIKTRQLRPFMLIHPALEAEFRDIRQDPHDAVLLGDAGDGFSYRNLNQAFRLLMEGAPLLAMGNNRYFQEADGLSLDIGPFVAALEYAAGTSAIILGKPSDAFFAGAVESLGCPASQVVMIGDDALADVEGALLAGLQGILVQTGKYRPGDETQIKRSGAVVLSDVTAAIDWILTNR